MIVPLLHVPNGAKKSEQDDFIQALHHFSIAGKVLVQVQEIGSVKDNEELLLRYLQAGSCLMDGFTVDHQVEVPKLLDGGLHVAFFSSYTDIEFLKCFPRERVGVSLLYGLSSATETFSKLKDFVGNLIFRVTESDIKDGRLKEAIKSICDLKASCADKTDFFLILPSDKVTKEEVVGICTTDDSLHPVVEACIHGEHASSSLPTFCQKMNKDSNITPVVDFIDVFISCIRTDRPDGLYTTVVCDENDTCLGLVYSNDESIRAAFLEKKGIYWSRSRGGLWRKGDTSGMHQELLSIKLDCDRDALKFNVIQCGEPAAFCHLLTRSCWGPAKGLLKLEHLLQDRKKSAPEGSYTKRLFNDSDLLRKKLLEEVQELVEAEEPDHIAAEAADVMYFMMTRCAAAGVTLADIAEQLDKRSMKISRRPGNAKDWRTGKAEEILKATETEKK